MVMRQIGGANGPYVDFGDLNDSQVDQLIQSGKFDNIINNPEKYKTQPAAAPTAPVAAPPPQTGTIVPGARQVDTSSEAGKIAPPSLQYAPQVEAGPERELGITAGQFSRGLISPLSIPGDINKIVSQASGGIIPTYGLPTTQDLDRLAQDWHITSPGYNPQGFAENELAAFSRGAGEAASMAAVPPIARGLASTVGYQGRILPQAAQLGRTLVTGGAGSAAGEAEAQLYQPDPLHPGLAAVGPIATSALVSGLTPASLSTAGRLYYGNPYNNLTSRLGIDLQNQTPLLEDAGAGIKSGLESNYRAAVVNKQPAGAGGVPGTDLTQSQYDSIVNGSDAQAASRVLQGQKIAPTLANELPTETNQLAAATIANNKWQSAHPLVKQALVPDDTERAAVEAQHGKGATPSPGLNIERGVYRAVLGEMLGQASQVASSFLGSDHKTAALMHLAGFAAPYLRPMARTLATPVGARAATLGATTGIDPAIYMTAPSGFAPPVPLNQPNQLQGQGQGQ